MYDFTKEDAVSITQSDGALIEQQVLSLDLRLGNKCNLQCVMCYPGESNQWYKIQEQITIQKELFFGYFHFIFAQKKENF
jgi:MoaA/NifB/PqqE/SkfB family radical SAM enzyme